MEGETHAGRPFHRRGPVPSPILPTSEKGKPPRGGGREVGRTPREARHSNRVGSGLGGGQSYRVEFSCTPPPRRRPPPVPPGVRGVRRPPVPASRRRDAG